VVFSVTDRADGGSDGTAKRAAPHGRIQSNGSSVVASPAASIRVRNAALSLLIRKSG
jgi:hypothetical protein